MSAATLWELEQGQAGIIRAFDKTLDVLFATRLTELGFLPGERICCVLAPPLGAPRIYQLANTTFSLDDEIARLLFVTEENGG